LGGVRFAHVPLAPTAYLYAVPRMITVADILTMASEQR